MNDSITKALGLETPTRVHRGNFEQWLRELRHTPLDQGKNSLFTFANPNRFEVAAACCLGVGALLVPRVNPFHLREAGLPPVEFVEWLGIPLHAAGVREVDQSIDLIPDWPEDLVLRRTPVRAGETDIFYPRIECSSASGLNDEWRLTFKQIADVFDYFGVKGVEFYG